MPDPVLLRGRTIVVRDWRPEDLESLTTWMRPDAAWRATDGPYFPRPTEEQIAKQLDRHRRAAVDGDVPEPRVVLAIADVEDDALLGRVSRYWQSEETQWLSLGIAVFDPTQWGRRIGYEALGLWSQYLLDALPDLPRLDLRTWSGNTRMMRLAERLGFALEARFRDAREVGGTRYDALGYGILGAEWQQRYPDGFARFLANSA